MALVGRKFAPAETCGKFFLNRRHRVFTCGFSSIPHAQFKEAESMSTNLPHLVQGFVENCREEQFGVLALRIADGAGRLTLPREISPAVLHDLRNALAAGQEDCSSVVLDWTNVSRCDVFFYQMLLAARRGYSERGKGLMAAGALPEDLSKACLAQGFRLDDSNSLLPLA